MTRLELLDRVARSDTMFERRGRVWIGKCLICNGPIAFECGSGEGVTVEHIRARCRGGTNDLANLAIVHPRCNCEKGHRWDPKRRRSAGDYDAFVETILNKRKTRWREPSSAEIAPPSGM